MAPPLSQDRLVRKEVALGQIREIIPPETHIGLTLCPWLPVQSDDVVFDYAKGLTDGLVPARAEDAEAELARKDDLYAGQGRASIIDWAVKDRYAASDVTRYRELVNITTQIRDTGNFPLTVTNMTEEWQQKLARDAMRRRRKLDNRLEWMVMTSLQTGGMAYNDGRIIFSVDYGRPALQDGTAATGADSAFYAGGTVDLATANFWDDDPAASDPIADVLRVQEYMYDLYGVRITRAITSRKALNSVMNSDKFIARTGLVGGTGAAPVDPRYIIDGWGPSAAVEIVKRATGVEFVEYDSVYRTRVLGATTVTNNRFTDQELVIFLPDEGDVNEFDNTEIGFGKMLTSPHPEGNWQPGFYEWERETVDPWGYDRGTGVKAFPVFPHMELTGVMKVLT